MKGRANLFERLPLCAVVATILLGYEIIGTSAAATTEGAVLVFFGVVLALAPLAQATGFSRAPIALEAAAVLVAVFVPLAIIELVATRLLRARTLRLRWAVRLGGLAVFAAVILLTPPAGPGRMF